MKKSILVILITLGSFSVFSASGDKSLGGCGIGWKIAPKNSMVSSTTRAITNMWFFPFATTTGTSGCDRHSIVLNDKMKLHFTENSYHELLVEISQGRGENLTAFSRVLGCNDLATSKVASHLKVNYENLIRNSDAPESFLESVTGSLRNDLDISKSCSELI